MKHRIDRIKKYIRYNKNAAIYIMIFIAYTIIMLCIWLIGSDGMKRCSSGSLSSIMNENTGGDGIRCGRYHYQHGSPGGLEEAERMGR